MIEEDKARADFFKPNENPQEHISYEIDGVERKIFGGSFFQAPTKDGFLTINLMKEYELPCDIYFPVKDYSIPLEDQISDLIDIFEIIKQSDQDVYVGCFGGIGRTGLFMASFLKYLGYENPVEIVRSAYRSHAVETAEQLEFVSKFPMHESVKPKKSFLSIFKF